MNIREILGWTDEQLEEIRFSGFSFLREGHYLKALLFFEALVVLNPLSLYDIQTLGALYLQLGDHTKALTTLDQALQIDPQDEVTLLNKTKTLLGLNQREGALEIARKLEQSNNASIAGDASALLTAYS